MPLTVIPKTTKARRKKAYRTIISLVSRGRHRNQMKVKSIPGSWHRKHSPILLLQLLHSRRAPVVTGADPSLINAFPHRGHASWMLPHHGVSEYITQVTGISKKRGKTEALNTSRKLTWWTAYLKHRQKNHCMFRWWRMPKKTSTCHGANCKQSRRRWDFCRTHLCCFPKCVSDDLLDIGKIPGFMERYSKKVRQRTIC